MVLSEQTFDMLVNAPTPAIAAVRCEQIQTRNAGSRSEKTVARVTVIRGVLGSPPPGVWTLNWFTADSMTMEPGRTYLVAAAAMGPDNWQPIERLQIEPASADSAVDGAFMTYQDRKR